MTTPTTEQLWQALRILFGPSLQVASLTVLVKTDGGHKFSSYYLPGSSDDEQGDEE